MGIAFDDSAPFSQFDAKRIFKSSDTHAGIALSTATQMRFTFNLAPAKWEDLKATESWDLLSAMIKKRKADQEPESAIDVDAEEDEAPPPPVVPVARKTVAPKGPVGGSKGKAAAK